MKSLNIVMTVITCTLLFFTIAIPGRAESEDHEDHEEHGEESGHGHEEASSKFGPGKAIEAVKEAGRQFKLSESAIRTIGVAFGNGTQIKPNVFSLPRTAIISFQDETGVYVQRDGWFEMIEVDLKEIKNQMATAGTNKLRDGDRIVISGGALLRIAHLEALGQGGEGHVH